MTEQARIAITGADEIAALHSELRAIREMLEGATIIPAPEWVSVSDAAAHFGVHVSTIQRKIERGELEARGSGKTRRVKVR